MKNKKGKKKKYFAHKTALIESDSIGPNTRIWAYAHIMKNAVVGSSCNIGNGCFLESGSKIGKNVVLKNGVSLWDRVEVKDDVFIGPNAVFTNDLRPRVKKIKPKFQLDKTIIGKGASVGANSTILSGVVIGEYSMVGAGSVVTKNIPDFALVVGIPARFKSYVCICSQPLNKQSRSFSCPSCKRQYIKDKKSIKLK